MNDTIKIALEHGNEMYRQGAERMLGMLEIESKYSESIEVKEFVANFIDKYETKEAK